MHLLYIFFYVSTLDGIEGCTSLQTLSLCGNPIASASDLAPLKNLPYLTNLSLSDPVTKSTCPLCLSVNYKTSILALLPRLRILDKKRLSFEALPTAKEVMMRIDSHSMRNVQSQPWIKQGSFTFRTDMLQNPNNFLNDSMKRAEETIAKAKIVEKNNQSKG